jgi:colanic acid biosynthesis glycosyl transferase WcaI
MGVDLEAMANTAKLMKVLIYSVNFAPEPTGIGKYSGEMAEWLVKEGHCVRVVSAPPYYPAWKVEPQDARPFFRREQWRGVDVWRAPQWVPKSPRGLARVLHLLSFAFMSFPVMMRQVFWRPDLMLAVAPSMLCAPAGLLTAKICGAQSWLHLQDFEVDLAFRMGLLKGKLLKRMVLRMERVILRRFDNVSSISSRMVETLVCKGVHQSRTRYFPNWVDVAAIKPSLNGGMYRAQLGIPASTFVVLFSGSLGGKQGLMVIPEVATMLSGRKEVLFLICGDGVVKPALEAATAKLSNVRFLPLQPVERLGELLTMADVHLLPQSSDAADLVLPSKLSGMLASGRPVIATCREETELSGVVSKCGLVVQPEDAAALAAAICSLVDDPSMKLELGQRARAFAETNFERDAVLRWVFGQIQDQVESVPDDAIA